MDCSFFLSNISSNFCLRWIAARGQGLETCPQAAFAEYHKVIRRELGVPADQIVICGMSMGHEDRDAPENKLTTERMELDDFVCFVAD